MPCKISMADVSFSFGTKSAVPILQRAKISVTRGEVVIIGGKSGQGTSTLLELLVGLMQPISGQVFWDDQDIASFSYNEMMLKRRKIGYVFQDCALISNLTIYDNIALPLRNSGDLQEHEVEQKVRSIMEEFGIQSIDTHYPESLSAWQLKAVAVARALGNDPDMLFLDELMGGIDPVTAAGILKVIEDRFEAYAPAIIMISHDLSLWPHRRAQRLSLENGALFPFGTNPGIDTFFAK